MNKNPLRSLLRLLFMTVVTLPAFLAQGQSPYFQAVTNLNPIAYWPLQETVQPPAADVENNLGSLGAAGNAYYSSTNVTKGLQGINSGDGDLAVNMINVTSSSNGCFLAVPLTDSRVVLPAGAFTVETWINPANATNCTLLSQTGPAGSGGLNGGANSAGWSLNIGFVPSLNTVVGGTFCFHVHNGVGSTGGAEVVYTPSSSILGNWHHVVGVFDGVNAFLYFDGALVAGSGVSGGLFTPLTGTQARDTWDPLLIGCGRGLNQNHFGGGMDEVAIYTNALSAARIQAHFNTGNSGAGGYQAAVTSDKPYMYWRMDAGAYTTPAASAYPAALNYGSGADINGLYLSGTTPGAAGPALSGMGSPSYACAVNGIGNDSTNAIPIFTNGVAYSTNTAQETGVIITNLLTTMNLFTNSMTFMCWFKQNPGDNHRNALMGHSDSSWRTSISGGNVTANTAKTGDFSTAPLVYNDGNWHFAAIVYSNTYVSASPGWRATNYIYVDGNLVTSVAITSATGTTSLTNISLGVAPDHVRTGNGGVYDNQVLAGSLAHAAFFTNALSGLQISNLYAIAGGVQLPLITGQPVSGRTNSPGTGNNGSGSGSYIFQGVQYVGATSLQWYFNSSSNYAGATLLASDNVKYFGTTTGNLTVSNLVDSDSGYYYVVLSSGGGSVTSILSSFTVINEPLITSQAPAAGSLQLFQGQNYALSVTAAVGETNFSYQWYTNGTADGTGTSATYSLTGVTAAMSGNTYRCVVSNIAGAATNGLVTLSVISMPAALTNNAYSSNLLALSPTAYWPMHEAVPAVTGDVETNLGSLGRLANGYYADWAAGAASIIGHRVAGALANDNDTAALFNNTPNGGSPGYLMIPRTASAAVLMPPFTIEAWVKPLNVGFGDIVSQGPWNTNANGTSGSRYGIRLGWGANGSAPGLNSDFQIYVGPGTGTGNPGYPSSVPQTLPVGNWYHIALTTADGTNWLFYVNGNQHYSFSLPMAPDYDPIIVGQGLWQSGGPNRGFQGVVDEVAIYTNSLQGGDISTHYNDGLTGAAGLYQSDVLSLNPIIYLRMNGPGYTPPPQSAWPVLNNYGANGGNGVYTPGALPGAVPGPVAGGIPAGNGVMPGNGMSSFADVGNSPLLNPTGTTPFSFGAWFRGNPADARSWQTLMGRTDASFRAAINAAGKLVGHAGSNDIASPLVYNDGNWHQFFVTYTGTNVTFNTTNTGILGVSTLYVDGAQVGQTMGGSMVGSAADVLIGDDPGNTNSPVGTGRCVAGQVCEAVFFSGQTLGSDQVSNLYTASALLPVITAQPVSASVDANNAFTNSVAAFGPGTLMYQWYRDNQPLPAGGQTNLTLGGNSASLVLNPVKESDASADYYVVVSNAGGSVTSSVVSLTVFTSPKFTVEPVFTAHTNSIVLFSNAAPTFNVSTIGAQPIYYQWFTNGVAATAFGTTLTNYTIPPVQLGGGGVTSIYCVATNAIGNTASPTLSLTGIPAPTAPYPVAVLADHPMNYLRLNEPNGSTVAEDYWGAKNGVYTNAILGGGGYTTGNTVSTDPTETSASFVTVTGQDSDAYAIGGIDFSTPTNASATFSVEAWVDGGTQSKDAGIVSKGYGGGGEQFDLDTGSDSPVNHSFRFLVRDALGAVHSANSTIAPVSGGPWYHLVGVCDEVNGTITLYVNGVVAGSTTITPGSGILSSSRNMLIGARPSNSSTGLNDLQFLGAVNDVAVYNYALSATQIVAHYTQSGVPPSFTQVPSAVITTNGLAALTIPATLIGTGPIGYYWQDYGAGAYIAADSTNGNSLNASLTTGSVPFNWNGDTLALTVTNLYGSTNITVTLNVYTNLQFVVNLPSPVTVVSGRSYTYSFNVVGPQPFSFAWYANNAPISGQNGSTMTVVAGAPGGSTNFFVVVTDSFGSVTSSVSLFTSVAANSYEGVVTAMSPAGYWPLQETNPPAPATVETNYGSLGRIGNAYYAFTNDATGNQIGFVTLAQGGATSDSDSAASFAGNSRSLAFVPRADPGLTIAPPLSLECWINSSSGAFSDIFGESGAGYDAPANGGNWGGVRLSYGGNDAGGPNLQFYVCNGNGSTRNAVSTAANTIPTGVWHHCVATYDGTNTVIYIDGAMSVTDTSSLSGANTENIDTWTPFSLGGSFWQTNNGVMLPARSYNGMLDEVAVYSNLLTAGQVSAHYAAASGGNYKQTITGDHPVLYYRMDCPAYTNPPATTYPIAVNYGSAPVNAVYPSGMVPGGVAGPTITGLANSVAVPGNGIFSCVDANIDPSFNPSGTNGFAAMAWVRCYPADPRVQTIMSHGVSNWAMNLDGTTGRIVWNTGSGGNVTSTNIVNDGKWHFVVGVQDGRTNSLYIDGALNSRGALAAAGVTGEPGAHLYLGGNQDFVSTLVNVRYLNGALAEAAFFTNALTAAQVQTLYAVQQVVPTISIGSSGGNIVITYTGSLVSSTNVAGPYQPVGGASSPYTVPPAGPVKFYRASNP